MSSAERCYSQARCVLCSFVCHFLLLSSPPLFAPSLPVRLVALQLSLLKESGSKEVINLEPKAVSKFVEEQPFIEASGSSLIVDLLLCF